MRSGDPCGRPRPKAYRKKAQQDEGERFPSLHWRVRPHIKRNQSLEVVVGPERTAVGLAGGRVDLAGIGILGLGCQIVQGGESGRLEKLRSRHGEQLLRVLARLRQDADLYVESLVDFDGESLLV